MHAWESLQELSISILLVVSRSRSEEGEVPGSAGATGPKKSCHDWTAKKSSRISAVREEPESRLVDIDNIFQVSELQSHVLLSTQNIEVVVVLEGSANLNVFSAKLSHGSLKVHSDISLEFSFHLVHVGEGSHDINLIEAASWQSSEGVSWLVMRNWLSHVRGDLSVVRQVA